MVRTMLVLTAMSLCSALAFAQSNKSDHGAPDECKQIAEACRKAGFIKGDWKKGDGLWRDCVNPIAQGRPRGVPGATKPLPSVDGKLVTDTRQSIKFGGGKVGSTSNCLLPYEQTMVIGVVMNKLASTFSGPPSASRRLRVLCDPAKRSESVSGVAGDCGARGYFLAAALQQVPRQGCCGWIRSARRRRCDNDGMDYVPTNSTTLRAPFAAIAGARAARRAGARRTDGLPAGTLWILVGVVLAGAVQDMLVLFASVRRDGRSAA